MINLSILTIIVIIIIVTILIVSIIFILKGVKDKKDLQKEAIELNRYSGPALNNIQMYKQREEVSLKIIAGSFPNYSKEKIYEDINELVNRLINAQNNGYISSNAFQKSGQDKVLYQIRTMTKLDTIIIGYEQNYASVAVIFENQTKELYQILLRVNIQNGLSYLDSYNATKWFNN